MSNTVETLLKAEAEQLIVLNQLLTDIEQSSDIVPKNAIQVYAPMPVGRYCVTDIEEKELSIFAKQANVIKKILQHPKCPENLSIEITLTDNYGTYASDTNRTRTPLGPIFEALASGKCTARGLNIKLVGGVLSSEMCILVRGLKEGKCPNNLHITFETLEVPSSDFSEKLKRVHTFNLIEALKSPDCPSGLKIEYPGYEKTEGRKRNHYSNHYCYEAKPDITDLNRLCTNGNYDRENIHRNIYKIYVAIEKELSSEISRLGGKDAVRREALETLLTGISTTCNDAITNAQTCDVDTTWEWKNNLRENLEKDIKSALDTSSFDKKHTALEKFGKKLLNLITGILFPLALIKYAATGSAFFSTVGKSHEAVEKTLNISKTIK